MTIKQLIKSIRMAPTVQDISGAKFSDYQLIDSINNALEMIYNTLAASDSAILDTTVQLKLKKGSTELPEDCVTLVDVYDINDDELTPIGKGDKLNPSTYRVVGNTLYTPSDVVTIQYKQGFTTLTHDDMDSDLPLPAYFVPLIKKYSLVMLAGGINQNDAQVIQQMTKDVYSITANRSWSYIVSNGNSAPWRV